MILRVSLSSNTQTFLSLEHSFLSKKKDSNLSKYVATEIKKMNPIKPLDYLSARTSEDVLLEI